jgi:S-adenosylmethionine synthetase
MCRYVAKNLVAAGIASQIEVQVSYAIGIAKPTSIGVDTFGTGKLPDDEIVKLFESHFDLRPKAIIDYFDLKRPIYRQVATYGHFGRNDLELPWEKLDQVEVLKKALSRG